MSLWTPVLEQLHDALEAERLLQPLREALHIRPPYSERADADLLRALRQAPKLQSSLALARQGNVIALREALLAAFPAELPPRLVQHLSLIWLQGARRAPASNDSPVLRRRCIDGLRGMLLLRERHPETMLELATASVDHATATRALRELPQSLLAPELAAIRSVSGPEEQPGAASRAWALLDELRSQLRHDLGSPTLDAELAELAEQAKEVAVENTLERLQRDTAGAEQLDADSPRLGTLFDSARRCVASLGHSELLSAWTLERAVQLSWPFHHAAKSEALRRLFEPLLGFADDLEARFGRSEALGRQGIFSDFWVMWAQSLAISRDLDDASGLVLLEQQQRRLRRSLALNPIHRNTKVVLAASNVNIVRRRLHAAKRTVSRTTFCELLAPLIDLLDEAQQLRPELSSIEELRADLLSLRQRMG